MNKAKDERSFQDSWTNLYGMIENKGKALCTLCGGIIVCRTSSTKRHFESNHSSILKMSLEDRKEYISKKIKEKESQSSIITKYTISTNNITAASFQVAREIAKSGKAFSDGEFFKTALVNCAESLFEDFDNKDKILTRINSIQLSANTVKDRILKMRENISDQLISDLRAAQVFALAVDESTDINSDARLAITVRYAVGGIMREELLKLATLPERTRGVDILQVVKKVLADTNVCIKKICSISTDGCPSMIGKDSGFKALLQNEIGHPVMGFHCMIHLDVLCAKYGLFEFNHIMETVTKVINNVVASDLSKRQFKKLMKDINAPYETLLMYNHVRWLSRALSLERFVQCLDEIRLFLVDKKKVFPELTDTNWLLQLELNVKMQGNGKSIDILFGHIMAFEMKLQLFKNDMESTDGNYPILKYIPNLKKFTIDIDIFKKGETHEVFAQFSEVLLRTQESFANRFHDVKKIKNLIKFVRYPDKFISDGNFHDFAWLNFDDFDNELLEFQCSFIWREKFESLRTTIENGLRNDNNSLNIDDEVLKVWQSLPNQFTSLRKLAIAVLTVFPSTYYCEFLFSQMNVVLTKTRNRMTRDNSEACVALKVTKYTPNVDHLASKYIQKISTAGPHT